MIFLVHNPSGAYIGVSERGRADRAFVQNVEAVGGEMALETLLGLGEDETVCRSAGQGRPIGGGGTCRIIDGLRRPVRWRVLLIHAALFKGGVGPIQPWQEGRG